MSIEQRNIIDIVGTNEENEAVLFITDHLDWEDPKSAHLMILQDKINDYLAAIESGELIEKYPAAKGKKVVIEVRAKYPLNELGEKFYKMASTVVRDAGFELRFVLADNSDSSHTS